MSAICASPADGGIGVVDKVPLDKVRALQHMLYRTAKANPGQRFMRWGTRSCAETYCGARAGR